MGYPADQASVQAEEDRLRLAQNDSASKGMYHDYISRDVQQKSQTKDEQEKLMTKMATYSQRTEENQRAATDASYVDFSKPIDQ